MLADYYYRFNEIGFYLMFLLVLGGIIGAGVLLASYFRRNNYGDDHGKVTTVQRIIVGLVCAGLFVAVAATNDPIDSREISLHHLTHAQEAEEEVERALGEHQREELNNTLP